MADVERKADAGADGFFYPTSVRSPASSWRFVPSCYAVTTSSGASPPFSASGRRRTGRRRTGSFSPLPFVPTLEWNRSFAVSAIGVIRSLEANVYFMPIRVNLTKYLEGLI